jgi:hypothetical protein
MREANLINLVMLAVMVVALLVAAAYIDWRK